MGLAIALLLLELALTVSGRVVTSNNDVMEVVKNREKLEEADFIIACFGDSHTFGVGATSKEQAYPSQLERILSERYPALNICVLNHGEPGTNSSQHIKNMKEILSVYPGPPDLVYILSFGSNPWCLNESSAIVEGYATLPPNKKIYVNMEKARIGKLAILLKLFRRNRGRMASHFARLNTPGGTVPGGTTPGETTPWEPDPGGTAPPMGLLLDVNIKSERDFLEAWIKHDMLEMRKLVEGVGSRPLFGLYLFRPENHLIREIMMTESVSFCKAPLDGEKNKELWSIGIEHPNNLGYTKMAESIADCLELKLLIPKTPRPRP